MVYILTARCCTICFTWTVLLFPTELFEINFEIIPIHRGRATEVVYKRHIGNSSLRSNWTNWTSKYISPEVKMTVKEEFALGERIWGLGPRGSLLNHSSRNALWRAARIKVEVAQSCLTLATPPGILQARILEWVAFPFSRGSFQPRNRTQVSHHCRWILYQLSHKGS